MTTKLKLKISTFQKELKHHFFETFNLLKQFKWYISAYLIFYLISNLELINPPAVDDPILNYEYSRGAWNYINQEVYIGSMKLYCIIETLIFFIGTSNMRNHPLLAKFIFLLPWIALLLGIIAILAKMLFDFIL